MAYLLPTFTHPSNGAVYPNAYARVFSVKKNKAQKVAIVQFEVFASQAARAALKDPVFMLPVQFMDTTTAPTQYCGNKWAFLYLYMFTLKHTSESLW